MNYPITRHYQRYEYIVEMGYVKNKFVVDVGAGNGYGLYILAGDAKNVVGIDPALEQILESGRSMLIGAPVIDNKGKKIAFIPSLFTDVKFDEPADVITAIEVFEHVENPSSFCKLIAERCRNAFITTPLAEVTGKTDNPEHVAEYSYHDFVRTIEENFEIIEFRFQLPDLTITPYAHFQGHSRVISHVVQMAWCKSKLVK